ncbi:DNA-binding protein [Siminovitchia terrae]|uniref:DNA-binding protein n=1 Tax=Siminovitchia terrae TaxID=1914933 RepID=A0A429XCP6_SIMTE|nr:XRE family transcriptional regulator [Siminovitchia terrae]RST61061.1 XRE family transcriptional regulator [Siminovitchia terrae]GIN90919.1 DNA-binding protein [Siminovitchia terrae]GIN97705.1 DNA-binding protein [Siminovitchia terrae]
MDNKLGREFKRIRKSKKLTLREVSERSGLSVSFLSQVERGISSVTFTSLRKIAEALEVNINLFFEAEEETLSIKKQTLKKSAVQPNFTYTSLVGNMENPKFYPARIELKAGESHTAPYTHHGQEFVYVLEGELKVVLENHEETLYAHESLHIDSTEKHVWYNETDQPVVLLVVSTNT